MDWNVEGKTKNDKHPRPYQDVAQVKPEKKLGLSSLPSASRPARSMSVTSEEAGSEASIPPGIRVCLFLDARLQGCLFLGARFKGVYFLMLGIKGAFIFDARYQGFPFNAIYQG